MRIAILCNDSRGGIQPYVALGLGLQRAGHQVQTVAPSDFAPMFAAAGLPFLPLSGSVEEIVRAHPQATQGGSIASIRFSARMARTLICGWTRETLAACDGADVLTGGVGGMAVGLSVAEKLGRPFVETHIQPLGFPTDAYQGVLFRATPRLLGGLGRRLSHHLSEAALWMPFKGAMNAAREEVLGLRGRPNAADGQPVLYGFSRHVVPVPPDPRRERHVTGYWTLPAPATWSPPPALEAFLAAGGPVVSLGFGSMGNDEPEAVTAMVAGAVRSAGVRAVLLAGWGGLKSVADADDLFVAEALPHDWLFPRVAAVVHHGGAGTTGAALRAGVPAIVVPFSMDQPFWGSRVAALGVGPAPIPRKRLTQARLADALRRTVANQTMRARAADLGALIRAEDGVGCAVAYLTSWADRGRLARTGERSGRGQPAPAR